MRRRTIVAVALLAILVLFVGGLVIYSAGVLSRFERVEARRSKALYAARRSSQEVLAAQYSD